MWRQKNSTVFAVLLIAITLNFIVTPTYAKTQNSKGRIMPLRVLPFKNLQMFTQKAIRLPWGIFWEAVYRILSIKNRTRHSAESSRCIRHTGVDSGFLMVLRCRASQTDKDHSDGS